MSGIFGSNDTTTKSTVPGYLKDASQDITARAAAIADRPYTPYTGERFAPLHQNQYAAADLASNFAGNGQNWINQAADLYGQSARGISDFNINDYMNPYIEQVLDPQLAALNEYYGVQNRNLEDAAVAAGAFGGSRHGVSEARMRDDEAENVAQTVGQGYYSAYNDAMNQINAEMARQAGAAGGLLNTATTGSGITTDDINRLLGTGAVMQAGDQRQNDFDYQQYLEQRDWAVNQLMPYIASVGGLPYNTATTTSTAADPLSQILGATLAFSGFGGV